MNMTENDTYKALMRPHISEMIDVWESCELFSYQPGLEEEELHNLINSFFEKYGWGVDEYVMAKIKWKNREPSIY